MRFVLWIHLLGMAVWTGGLVTMAVLVGGLRKDGVDRSVLQAMARRFGPLQWAAMVVTASSGLVLLSNHAWTAALAIKVILVLVVVALAAWHQIAAREQSASVRGALQGAIGLLSLVIVLVAVLM